MSELPADQFYTGLVAAAYVPLRGTKVDPEPYARFVARHGTPALEIGCGHGEPLLDLVAAGLDVTGVDSSADMLALCAAAARASGLTVTLVCQAMEELSIDRTFRSIYFAGPTFQLVVDRDAAAGALTRIAQHLDAKGRVLVPLFRPQPIPAGGLGRWREHGGGNGDPSQLLAVSEVDQSYRFEQRRVDTTLRYRRGPSDAPIEVVDRVWSLRWYEGDEFEVLSAASGLRVDRRHDLGGGAVSYVLARSDA